MTEHKSTPPKKFTRREILGGLGILGAGGLAAAAGLKLRGSDDSDTSKLPEDTHVPSTPEVIQEKILLDSRGVQVWQDQHGVPTRIVDAQGNEINIDQVSLLEANQNAIQKNTGRWTVGQVHEVATQKHLSQEAEPITHMPEDTLSKEQLAARGIEIIGSDTIDLHLRPSAFEPGGLLEHFQINTQDKLVIIITDQAALSSESLAGPAYDAYRPVIHDHFSKEDVLSATEIRQLALERIDRSLDHARKRNNDSFAIQDLEVRRHIVEQTTDQQIYDLGLHHGSLKGYALPLDAPRSHPEKSIVFLAITPETVETQSYVQISTSNSENYFNASIADWNIYDAFDMPRPYSYQSSESYPQPENYRDNLNPGTFTGGAIHPEDRDTLLLIHHELSHINLSMSGLPSDDEVLTDKRAMESISRAANSPDRAGYSFVLENKTKGTFVVT